mgnify:CR=1 FL=1
MSKKTKFDAYAILKDQLRCNEESRVASYAARVGNAQSKAEQRLIDAEKEVRRAKKVIKKQAKALAKFKESGDTRHLAQFGV